MTLRNRRCLYILRVLALAIGLVLPFVACSKKNDAPTKTSAPPVDESDIAGTNPKNPPSPFESTEPKKKPTGDRPHHGPSTVFTFIQPDRVHQNPGEAKKVKVNVVYLRGNQALKISGLDFQILGNGSRNSLECPYEMTSVTVRARLENDFYKISGAYRAYAIQFNASCGSEYTLYFNEATAGGQVISIVETVERTMARLDSEIGLKFWNDRVIINYPARSNYYALGEVNVTSGSKYEAVAHELGHAVYDMGLIGRSEAGAGTQSSVTEKTGSKIHRIDQCYNEEFAFSEGWATFFAGWLYLDLNNPDAHFTQIVPRRSPIQIENVPSDVCPGPKNEWRVAAFFWDLIDSQNDGETAQFEFSQLWKAMSLKEARDTRSAAIELINDGLDANSIRAAYKLNFNVEL